MAQVKTVRNINISYPAGFEAGSMHCGIKAQGDDISLLLCPGGAAVGGILSANRFRSLSLDDASRKLKNRIQALLVFSGNATIACITGVGDFVLVDIEIIQRDGVNGYCSLMFVAAHLERSSGDQRHRHPLSICDQWQ